MPTLKVDQSPIKQKWLVFPKGVTLKVDQFAMTASSRQKWLAFPKDIKAAFDYALNDAVKHARCARYVPEYHSRRIRAGKLVGEEHTFRIGYAVFKYALFPDQPAVTTDLQWLTENEVVLRATD